MSSGRCVRGVRWTGALRALLAMVGMGAMTALGVAGSAQAQTVTLGPATFSGNGCASGSTNATFLGSEAELEFFANDAENMLARQFDSAACSIVVTVNVPPGTTQVAAHVEWEGEASDLGARELVGFARTLSYDLGLPALDVSLFDASEEFDVADDVQGVSRASCGGGTAELRLGTLLTAQGAAGIEAKKAKITLSVVRHTPRSCP
jgi:hypothetical protein